MTVFSGSCHCGKICFTVEGVLRQVMDCNCSICRKTGFLHWIVPEESVQLTSGEPTTYVWGTGTARHLFCPLCGVAPLRRPRLDPMSWSVNVRCLDGVDLLSLEVEFCDGALLPLP